MESTLKETSVNKLNATLDENTFSEIKRKKKIRYRSLDITRGLIVLLSVFLFHIPPGGYEYLRHAKWYGITIMDFILPGFITVFGAGMAFAYHKGVNWKKFLKRTFRLLIYGLIFNMIVDWRIDFSTIRLTGVLQLYAILGILTILITHFVKSWKWLLIIAFTILGIHGFTLLTFSKSCAGGLPQMDCNPSGIIDVIIFGSEHLYYQGKLGYDPEGVLTIFASLANVLIGYASALILLENREKGAWKELITSGIIILICAYLASNLIPFNKKIWTPSFALITAGSVVTIFGIAHLLFDRTNLTRKSLLVWYIEAFGRNSFLIYFGKFVVYSLLIHTMINIGNESRSISDLLYSKIQLISDYPQLTYAFVMLLGWSLIAVLLHAKKWYIKA